jgi:uncharacterized protein (TIGR02466 family)|tara:strand:- start:910 stop:1527 length:618 start_codon:yes stop_codon:yes gene_type:complete
MDLEILNLKAIPIGCQRKAYFLNKKELNALKKTKYNEPQRVDGFYLSKTIALLENKTLASLKKFIVERAEEYTRDVLEIKDKIYLTQSWSTINNTDSFHDPHQHPNTFISIVYYAQCESGALRFFLNTSSIKECFNFDYTISKFNIYNSQLWNFPVKSGDIVFFPGHVSHGSASNKSPESRIIVGANFFLKGKIGSKKDVSLITI